MSVLDIALWALSFVKAWGPLAGVAIFFWKGAAWFERYQETTRKLEAVNANMARITAFVEQADRKGEILSGAHEAHRRQYEKDRQEHREEHSGIHATLKQLLISTSETRGKLDSIHE